MATTDLYLVDTIGLQSAEVLLVSIEFPLPKKLERGGSRYRHVTEIENKLKFHGAATSARGCSHMALAKKGGWKTPSLDQQILLHPLPPLSANIRFCQPHPTTPTFSILLKIY